MLSPRLEEFLSSWCDAEGDPADVIKPLHETPVNDWALWLQSDMRDLIINNGLTADKAQQMTGGLFTSQADVDSWLAALWQLWFPTDPLPGPATEE